MQVAIVPSGTASLVMMKDLGQLGDELMGSGLDMRATRASIPGVKDGGLTVAIEIAGLALSGISTLLSVLSYWAEQKPQYEVTAKVGELSLKVSGLDGPGLKQAVQQLQTVDKSGTVVVTVAGS